MMSKYSEISKRIGWTGHCAIPSIDTAVELNTAVILDKSLNAFEMVFKIHRFAPSPVTQEETKAMKYINEAFRAATVYFSIR